MKRQLSAVLQNWAAGVIARLVADRHARAKGIP